MTATPKLTKNICASFTGINFVSWLIQNYFSNKEYAHTKNTYTENSDKEMQIQCNYKANM